MFTYSDHCVYVVFTPGLCLLIVITELLCLVVLHVLEQKFNLAIKAGAKRIDELTEQFPSTW